ncbi:MAG: MFS transporter [Acidobacteria bacterium]|nr:MFS transporter [Acidobacteriota bacterium]
MERVGRRRWRIAALLGLGVLVNYMDRVNLSVSHDALHQSFAISDVTFGYLLSAYNFTYCLCQLPMGVVLDKFGVKRVGRVSTFLWSIASFAAAIANSVPAFFGARFLLGIGESPIFPSNAKAIGHWFPRHERSFATALFDSAAKFSSAIGVPLIGILLLHVGWRMSFAFTGLISLIYFVLFTTIYREPEEDARLTPEEWAHIHSQHTSTEVLHEKGFQFTLPQLLMQPKVIGLSLGVCAYNYVFYLLLTWLPTYLSQSLGIDLLHSFLYTGFPWLVATAVDLAVGGWFVDWLIHRGVHPGKLRIGVLIIGMIFGLGILGAAPAHTAASALFWITISLAGLSAAAPIVWSAPSLIAPRANVATVGGIVNFSGQLAAITAPIVTGYLVARTHSFASAFVVAGVCLAVGTLSYATLLRSVEPMKAHRAG